MKTIVLGFENADGNGNVTLLAGPEISQESQLKLVNDAKSGGSFPDGVARIEFCIHEPRIVAINTKTTEPKKKRK